MFKYMTHLNLGVAKWVSHQPTSFWQVEMLFEPTVTGGRGGLNLKKWKKKFLFLKFLIFLQIWWVNPLLACQPAFLYFFFFYFFGFGEPVHFWPAGSAGCIFAPYFWKRVGPAYFDVLTYIDVRKLYDTFTKFSVFNLCRPLTLIFN